MQPARKPQKSPWQCAFGLQVPSATAGYNTSYTESMLESAAARCPSDLRSVCDSQAIAGYCGTLADYLQDACGAHEGSSLTRTVLFGLQRPPLDGGASVVRLEGDSTVDDVAPYLVPFLITNARETLQISAPVEAVRSCTVPDARMRAFAMSTAPYPPALPIRRTYFVIPIPVSRACRLCWFCARLSCPPHDRRNARWRRCKALAHWMELQWFSRSLVTWIHACLLSQRST